MGNLSLGHPLASWSLYDWNQLWRTTLPFLWQRLVTSSAISVTSFSFYSSALLEDFSSSSSSWSSPSRCSGTSCLTHLPSPHCDVLTRFMLLVSLKLISFISYTKGTQAVITLATMTALAGWNGQVYFVCLNSLPALLHHQCKFPRHLLLARMHSLAKTPHSLLITMSRVFGSDKVINSYLICKIKVDNGHGPVAHSAWVPPFSIQLLISKLGIMILLLIDLSTSVQFSHITINQKDCVFGHVLSPSWYCDTSFPLYVGLLISALPVAFQLMHARPFLLEALTHFPWTQTMLPQQNLLDSQAMVMAP